MEHTEDCFDATKSGSQEVSFSISCRCGWSASGTTGLSEADARSGNQQAAAYAAAAPMLADHIAEQLPASEMALALDADEIEAIIRRADDEDGPEALELRNRAMLALSLAYPSRYAALPDAE